ncbi:radical SAM protein [Candidatus Pacearchaeota archaeon]|nr:radical SAM protein [Candidatus Pacearchaeota archaeon]
MKNFGALSAVVRNRISRKNIPIRAVWKVTKVCNLRCKHCLEHKFQDKDVPLDKMKYILDKLAEAGTKHLSINGGEPLMRKDIGEIIRYAKKLGMSVGITTNGSLLPHKINEIKGIDILGLSLDGPKSIHDYIRGKGQFDEVMTAIKIARENGIKNVYINTVLTKIMCDKPEYIDEIAKIAKENKIKCNFVTMYGDVRDMSMAKPSDEQLKRAILKIIEMKKRGVPILFSKFTYQYLLDWPDLSREKYYAGENPNIKSKLKCKSGVLSIAVEANGDVYPCNMVKDEVKPINIFEFKGSFSELLDELNKRNKCRYCYYGCYCEANALFALKPSILAEYARNTVKKIL